MKRRLLVTSALPYANGPIHVGHLLEYIQADTWVRFMRMTGNEVHFVCADDSHGTPVMLEAERQGITPEELIERMRKEHLNDFTGFHIEFNNYYTTHSPENKELSEMIFGRLEQKDLIARREVTQLYDPERGQFLADRYIRGICPFCEAEDQTGDNCENCSAVYAATDLKNPRSTLSGATLEQRSSEHYFFTLAAQTDFLREWLDSEDPGPGPGPRLQPQVRKKLLEWFEPGLQDWDISRDAPYFGFLIPGTSDKYFYVWLDAPIGYLASFKQYAAKEGIDFDDFMRTDSDTEMYHFIGKDIINFHGLFWPAILQAAELRTPTRLFVHGFLTVNAAKMSKSKGTFIMASSYSELGMDPDWLRYYMMSKLNENVEDVDLNMEDFVARVNTDLVNKLANIPSRVARILSKKFDNRLAGDAPKWDELDLDELADQFERRRFGEVTRAVVAQAEQVNRELEKAKPWEMVKQPDQAEQLHMTCSAAIQSFRRLAGILKPIVPAFAAKAQEYLNCGELSWEDLRQPLPGGHQLGKFSHLMTRLGDEKVAELVEKNREITDGPSKKKQAKAEAANDEHGKGLIKIDDFTKIELKVAKVLSAAKVEKADRLVELRVDLGQELGERTIFAGILGDDLGKLPGRNIVVCANLEPRKMRFGVSEGMALGALGQDGNHHFLAVSDELPPGSEIS